MTVIDTTAKIAALIAVTADKGLANDRDPRAWRYLGQAVHAIATVGYGSPEPADDVLDEITELMRADFIDKGMTTGNTGALLALAEQVRRAAVGPHIEAAVSAFYDAVRSQNR